MRVRVRVRIPTPYPNQVRASAGGEHGRPRRPKGHLQQRLGRGDAWSHAGCQANAVGYRCLNRNLPDVTAAKAIERAGQVRARVR